MTNIIIRCKKLQNNINNNTKWYSKFLFKIVNLKISKIYKNKYKKKTKKYHSGIEKTRANCKQTLF